MSCVFRLTALDLQTTGRDLCEMELERIIRREGDEQASCKELTQRITMIAEKQRVVAKRWHRNANLCNVVQILKNWALQHTHIFFRKDQKHIHMFMFGN